MKFFNCNPYWHGLFENVHRLSTKHWGHYRKLPQSPDANHPKHFLQMRREIIKQHKNKAVMDTKYHIDDMVRTRHKKSPKSSDRPDSIARRNESSAASDTSTTSESTGPLSPWSSLCRTSTELCASNRPVSSKTSTGWSLTTSSSRSSSPGRSGRSTPTGE